MLLFPLLLRMRRSAPVKAKSPKEYSVSKIDFSRAKAFIHQWHYSRYCPPGRYYFGLLHGTALVGACVFGKPTGNKMGACYYPERPEGLLELRRLACIDNTPRNTESYFIGKCLRILKADTDFDRVVSLADPTYGHSGTIYRASNFRYVGREAGHGTRFFLIDGKRLHAKTAFDRYGVSGLQGLERLLGPGRIKMVVPEPKHVYLYELKKNKKHR